MTNHRVAIVAGARTPFVKAGQAFSSLGPLALAKHAVRGLLDRHSVDVDGIDAIAFGTVVPERGKPNLAREIVFEVGLPAGIEAQTVSSYLHHRLAHGDDHCGRHCTGADRRWNRRRRRVAERSGPGHVPGADHRSLDGRAHGDHAEGVEHPAGAAG